MTISSETSRTQYSGSGSTGPFNIGFTILDDDHLNVVHTDTDGVNTTYVKTTDYTVSSDLTTITLLVALASGEKLTITRSVPLTQLTDYEANSTFPAETHEEALDKITQICQQINERVDRAVKLVVDSDDTDLEVDDPTGNSNKFLYYDGTTITYSAGTSVVDALTATDGNFIVGDGSTWVVESGATARTSIGLGTGNSPTFTNMTLSGTFTLNSITYTGATGADTTLVSGTAGTSGDLALWNVDGDIVDGPTPPSGTIVGTSDAQTLTNKTINTASNNITIVEADISDLGSYITANSADTLTNKAIDADGTGNAITNIGSSEIKSEMITGQTDTAIAAGDSIIYSDADDSGNLKKDTVQGILDLVSGSSAASQTEMEAASSTSVYVSPGRQHFHPGSSKCWGIYSWASGTPTLSDSYNVTSLTDSGAGTVGVVIATDMADANYSVVTTGASAGASALLVNRIGTDRATTGFTIYTQLPISPYTATDADTSQPVGFSVLGDM